MRDAVRNVAKYFPTAIVTGRCTEKVYLILVLEQYIIFKILFYTFYFIRKFVLNSTPDFRVQSNVVG
jgi:hypothetical protein